MNNDTLTRIPVSADEQHSHPAVSQRPPVPEHVLAYALLLSVTLALYSSTLYFNFVWDDALYIFENYQIQGLTWPHLKEIWTASYLGNYAPVHNSVLALIYSLGAMQPFGYHLAQLLLHSTCVCVLYLLLRKIESGHVAFLAALLFAVYPPNIENVAWISEIKSTLAFLFFLLSFCFFVRMRERGRWTDLVYCSMFLILSLLSKINTVVAPAIFLLYDYKSGIAFKKSNSWKLACLFVIGGIFGAVHLAVSHRITTASAQRLIDATITESHFSASSLSGRYFGSPSVHLLNLPRLFLFYLRMVVDPKMSAWHMFRIYGQLNMTLATAWIGCLGLLWLGYRSSRDIQFWSLWFVIFLIPVLQIVPNPVWVADRYLYIPVVGAFVLLSKLFFATWERLKGVWGRRTWEAVALATVLAFSWQTHQHLPLWQNDLRLWTETVKTCDGSAYCHHMLGQALQANGFSVRAVEEYFRAVQLRPDQKYLIALGDAYTDGAGDYQRALQAYRVAYEGGGQFSIDFLAKVAKAYYLMGDLPEAKRAIDAGQKMNPNNSSLLIVKTFLEWKQGNRDAARSYIRQVLAQNAVNPMAAHPARFLNRFWGRPAEVGRLLADLGPLS